MRASDLVRIDLDGNVAGARCTAARDRVNKAGFAIHSAIHAAREDLAFVAHTHTAAGIAVSAQRHGLLPISQHALNSTATSPITATKAWHWRPTSAPAWSPISAGTTR